jgi:ABC-2 type transport system ATP-binding protein
VEGRVVEEVVLADGVSKSFDGVEAVRDLSFSIGASEVFGLLGPNGAGKTTTIRMLNGILFPDGGRIEVFGRSVGSDPSLRARIGYLPEERGLYQKMRARDVLVFFAALNGVSRPVARERADELLRHFSIDPAARVESLSKGTKAKLLMGVVLIHDPSLLVLDEPFSGLDPLSMRMVRDIIIEKKRAGAAIVLSTHQMADAEMLCDRICLIDRGRRVVYGPLAEVRKAFGKQCCEVEGEGDLECLRGLGSELELVGNTARVYGADRRAVLQRLLEHGVGVTSLRVSEAPLERIFLDNVGPRGGGSAARPDG